MTKVVFLDIDGVLNKNVFDEPSGTCGIDPENIAALNHIVESTRAALVLSSSWRHHVHNMNVNLMGFGLMLRTHGLDLRAHFVGMTEPDHVTPPRPTRKGEGDWDLGRRPKQIHAWLNHHYWVKDYVILDDLDMADELSEEARKHFIRTDGDVGLTLADAARAVEILNGTQEQAA
jgi:hypothetical protein